MKSFFKLARIGFYMLMLFAFFIIGLFYAGYTEAGSGQGLAGGAIVLGYGVLFGGIAFIASFFIARYLKISKIKIMNWVLLVFILVSYGYVTYKFQRNKNPKEEHTPEQKQPTTRADNALSATANLKMELEVGARTTELGLGFFKPNFFEHPTLYFYGPITHGKSVDQHTPQDSIALNRDRFGDFSLVSAPPWLWPEAMNQPFGIFYFKVIGIGRDFISAEGNSSTGQKVLLDKRQGQLYFWPEFLHSANSITFVKGKEQLPKIKPLDNAITIGTPFMYMRVLEVKREWLLVSLEDNNRKDVAKGWIRWIKDGALLIDFTFPNIEK